MVGSLTQPTIAVLGGTGKEGKGLAYRWAKAGYTIIVGSRDEERARITAAELLGMLDGKATIHGMDNLGAAKSAEIVVLAMPFAAHTDALKLISPVIHEQLFIDVTVPLIPPKVTQVHIPPAGSAGLEDRSILGPEARIAIAFQNISADLLLSNDPIECDVLVAGVNKAVRTETIDLVGAAGLSGWDAGPLENSIVIEGLTSILIHINRQYGSKHAGIKITGVE